MKKFYYYCTFHSEKNSRVETKNTRIGILGGSFDPIHKAHLAIAESAYEQSGLSKIIFIPAKQAPLRDAPVRAQDADRLAMLKLALRNFKYPYEIDEFEIRRHQTSYSIDTALHLSNKYPGAELCWIIGADHIGKLSQWKQIEKLGKIISFICAVRNGYDTDETLIPQGVKLEFIDFAPLPYSSTEIRNRLKNGLDCDLMLDPSVKKYILEHRLYEK